MVKSLLANAGDAGLIPESGRSPEEENGNPLQCSCLGNSIDTEACVQKPAAGYGPRCRKRVRLDLAIKQQQQ